MAERNPKGTRWARGSGKWFPGDSGQLERMVDGYLSSAEIPPVGGRIVGAVAPHAGYVYSGPVAGYTFRAIRDNAAENGPETVVILGFSHRGGFSGVALMDGDAIETPLGRAALDNASGEFIAERCSRIAFNYAPHAEEHSAENQIPFLQQALPETPMVVALMGDHDSRTVGDVVSALSALAENKRILVVASTDLLHDSDYDLVSRTDRCTLDQMAAMDIAGLLDRWDYSSQVCCGIGPVAAVMRFASLRGCVEGTVLRYCNSGDDFPESRGNWVVGYGACVFAVPA